MAKGKKGGGWGVAALVAGVLGAGALAVGGLWIMSAAKSGKKDAPLVPNWLERPIDDAVAALNNAFGKRWVDQGIGTIQQFLLARLPSELAPMAAVLFDAEQTGNAAGWSGQQKKRVVASRMT